MKDTNMALEDIIYEIESHPLVTALGVFVVAFVGFQIFHKNTTVSTSSIVPSPPTQETYNQTFNQYPSGTTLPPTVVPQPAPNPFPVVPPNTGVIPLPTPHPVTPIVPHLIHLTPAPHGTHGYPDNFYIYTTHYPDNLTSVKNKNANWKLYGTS